MIEVSDHYLSVERRLSNFVDISLSWEPNPKTGDISIIINERAISNSMKNLLMISPTEVPFRSDVGSTITDYMFELADPSTEGYLNMETSRTLTYNEPRVKVTNVNSEVNLDTHDIEINIAYKLIGYDDVFYYKHLLSPTK